MAKTFRWLAVLAAVLILAPGLADARAGGGGGTGSGSRGSKTNQAPPPTQTAPATKPIERSTTPQQAQAPTGTAAPQTGSFFSRHPFVSGMLGGLFGAGLFGMLFGGGFGGGAGMFGLLVQLLLIGGLGYLALRLFRGWSAARTQPANGGMGPGIGASAYIAGPAMESTPMARSAGGPVLMGNATAPLAIAPADYTSFEALLSDIQGAYGNGDLARLRSLVTPEMLGYFSEQLSDNASHGVENKVSAVKLEQGDLAEAWSEGSLDYATVAMRFSMIDVTRRIADGTVVEGSERDCTRATEVWTFLRSHGGSWILSAIQQT